MSNTCFLQAVTKCDEKGTKSKRTNVGFECIVKASKSRGWYNVILYLMITLIYIEGDKLHESLPAYDSRKYRCHKDCISTYTSKYYVMRDAASAGTNEQNYISQVCKNCTYLL